MSIDMTDPEVAAAVKAVVQEATGPLQLSIDKLEGKNRELVTEKQTINDKFEGIDPEQFRKVMATFENDEEAKLISEGKTNEVVDRRLEKTRKEWNERIDATTKERDEAVTGRTSAEQRLNHYAIEVQVRREAERSGILPEAIDDVVLSAKGQFKLDDNMKAILVDKDGDPIKNGKGEVITAAAHLLDLKESKAYWWPTSKGGKFAGSIDATSPELQSELSKALADGDHGKFREIRKKMKSA